MTTDNPQVAAPQHTPGPWHIRGEGKDWHVWNDGKGIASLWFEDEAEANANLIAAAPEMLEALKAIRKVLIEAGPSALAHFGGYVNGGTVPHFLDVAIAKAEGK